MGRDRTGGAGFGYTGATRTRCLAPISHRRGLAGEDIRNASGRLDEDTQGMGDRRRTKVGEKVDIRCHPYCGVRAAVVFGDVGNRSRDLRDPYRILILFNLIEQQLYHSIDMLFDLVIFENVQAKCMFNKWRHQK